MRILLTNDDGIQSPVLKLLADAVSRKHEAVVVAPSTDQSGMAQAFTFNKGITYKTVGSAPCVTYQVDGTPCDCIKFAISHLCRENPPELVISGINLGENAGISAIYSGTVAAAREGALWGIPSVAVSVWKNSPDHIAHAIDWLMRLIEQPDFLATRPGTLWNINFPPCDPGEIEGYEITSMSTVMFKDHYVPATGPSGGAEYRLVGHKPVEEFREGSDDYALHCHRIAITPLGLSQSEPEERDRLRTLKKTWQLPAAAQPSPRSGEGGRS